MTPLEEGLSARVGELELRLAAQMRAVAEAEREASRARETASRLRAVVETKDQELAQVTHLVQRLRLEVADLRRRVDRSSANSSQPPSQDRLDQRKPKAGKEDEDDDDSSGDGCDDGSGVGSGAEPAKTGKAGKGGKKRRRGGQVGHRGSGLQRATGAQIDQILHAGRPVCCSGCQADLSGAAGDGSDWLQVWDIPPVRLEKTEWRLPRIRCGCGVLNRGQVGWGRAGQVVYGPNVTATAIGLNHYGTVPIQRTAELMDMLIRNASFSTGWVAGVSARLGGMLERAGYDQAVDAALVRQKVLAADETPVRVARKTTAGSPHIFGVGSPDGKLRSLQAWDSRSKKAVAGTMLSGYLGVLVRDDYNAYAHLDSWLAGVQLCGAHLLRQAAEVIAIDPAAQAWAAKTAEVLRQACHAVNQARARGDTALNAELLKDLRRRYDQYVAAGVQMNTGRAWAGAETAHHPGYNLAVRLRDKAEQVWLFTKRFDVPFTNNVSEQRIRMSKVRQNISGCWHTMKTLRAWCRIRSYLDNTRNHGLTLIEAISRALRGNPWLPELT